MLKSLLLLGSCLGAPAALLAHGGPVLHGPPLPQGQGQPQGPAGLPNFHPPFLAPTPLPTPASEFHPAQRLDFDDGQDYDRNHGSKLDIVQDSGARQPSVPPLDPFPRPTHVQTTRPRLSTPPAQVTPDFVALGSLLDRVSQDQAEIQLVLAGRGSLDRLSAGERAKVEALLADRDQAEQLLQARLQTAPIPMPQSTPSSARPLATPTPIP